MTPEQIASVRRTLHAIGDHPDFAARFYGRLFEAAPHTAPMFGGDQDRQQQALTAELAVMVEMLDDLRGLEGRTRELGHRHRGYGVRAADYRTAGELMAATLDELLGDQFGPDDRVAWNRAYRLILELMLST